MSHNLLDLSAYSLDNPDKSLNAEAVGTVFSNLISYGYIPSKEVATALQSMNAKALISFWSSFESAIQEITGANRNMGSFVVYKNFPVETLSMSESEYWIRQVFIYLGVPSELLAETEEPRAHALEDSELKVLHLASKTALKDLFAALCAQPNRWTEPQVEQAEFLVEHLSIKYVSLSVFGFKENGLSVISKKIHEEGFHCSIPDATDVIRLAALLSGQEASLSKSTKFKSFKRAECRMLLGLLENTKNLFADVSMRQELWKRLLSRLHVSDYKFEKVTDVYDALYKGNCESFDALIAKLINKKDASAIDILVKKPGIYARRFHELYQAFGTNAVLALEEVSVKLNTLQLIKLIKYIETINAREQLIFAPQGNWTKAQIVENKKVKIKDEDFESARVFLAKALTLRLADKFPEGVELDKRLDAVKLQTNDQKLADYGRGTTFDIPENVNFVRSGSYWEDSVAGNTWYDNGWSFYAENWDNVGVCCWNKPKFSVDAKVGAHFSGDPVNSRDVNGRACQMIDLYLEELEASGIHYAVWNTLCYSGRAFSKAEDVVATLQWGENPHEGELYDAKRAQMVFKLQGDSLTKYIAMIDVKKRKLVYLDANFYGDVQSAAANVMRTGEQMKAYMEYLESLPSVYDLMSYAPMGKTKFLLNDKDVALEDGEQAYVFKPLNEMSNYEAIDIRNVLEE